MKNTLPPTFIALLLFFGAEAQAPQSDSIRLHTDSARLQNDSAKLTDTAKAGAAGAATPIDDSVDPAIFAVFLVLVGVVVGAGLLGLAVIGVILASLFLLGAAGVLSAGVLVGLYKRSVTAGFKTVLLLACSLGGILVGSGGFFAVNRLFHLHIASRTVLFTGAGGGLLAGLLLGLIAFALIRAVLSALKQRLAF